MRCADGDDFERGMVEGRESEHRVRRHACFMDAYNYVGMGSLLKSTH